MQPSVNFMQGLPPTGRSRSHHLMSPAGEQAPRICTNSQEVQRQILLSAAGVEASSDLPSSLSLSLSFKQFRAFSKEPNVSFAFPFPMSGTWNVSLMAITQTVHNAALLRSPFVCFTIKILQKSTVAQGHLPSRRVCQVKRNMQSLILYHPGQL